MDLVRFWEEQDKENGLAPEMAITAMLGLSHQLLMSCKHVSHGEALDLLQKYLKTVKELGEIVMVAE